MLIIRFSLGHQIMNIFNYIRVSTQIQNTERQLAGIASDVEFLEKVSGKDKEREQLNLMLTMMGAFSEFERNIMLERQREGIAVAKFKGKYKGRKSTLSKDQLAEMKIDFNSGTMKKIEIAKKYKLTRAIIYQLCANDGC